MKKKKCYSYDVFDTCLIRSCGRPTYVFILLAERILGNCSTLESLRNDFVLERIQGEQRARTKLVSSSHEDVTLSEIYDCCDFSFATDMSINEIQKIEIEIEEDVLLPVYSIQNEIKDIHKGGDNVVFISDMYLPSKFIERILRKYDLMTDADRLYVSCEIGKNKMSGHLFEFIKENEGFDYKLWLHKGDNKYSDVEVPKRYGIRTKHVLHEMSYYENVLRKKDYSGSRMNVQLLASICKAVRLQYKDDSNVKFAADFIAPIYVPYVYYLLEEVRNKDISKLYFLARDGYIFYQIALKFADLFPGIELHYLSVSRTSLYLPSLNEISEKNILDMFWNKSSIRLRDVIERLQLDGCKLPAEIEGVQGRELITKLCSNDEICRIIQEKIQTQKGLAAEYFLQEGLYEGSCAIFDLTGSLKCLEAINRILKNANMPLVEGFYFEVLPIRLKGMKYNALNYSEYYEYNRINKALLPHDLFEQYFSITNQLRTVSYKKEVKGVIPVFADEDGKTEYKDKIFETNRAVCLQFADHYRLLIYKASHDTLCNTAISVYSDFYNVPKKEFLLAIKDFFSSESKYKISALFYDKSFWKALFNTDHRWRTANLMLTCPFPHAFEKYLRSCYADGDNETYPWMKVDMMIAYYNQICRRAKRKFLQIVWGIK